jgi:hypothetical protein
MIRCKHAPTNMGLLKECHINDMWTKKVIPMLIAWLGCQACPWSPAKEDVVMALRTTCEELYVEEVAEKIPFGKKDEPCCLMSES